MRVRDYNIYKIASPKLKLYFPTHLRAVELLSRRGPLKNSAKSDHIKEEHIARIFSFLKTLLKKRKDIILNVAMHQKLVHISLN